MSSRSAPLPTRASSGATFAPLVVLAFAPPAAKPFDIVWSGLWQCCAGQSGIELS
eukprot:COSAG06_NODE_13798_length_1218_cov_1.309205_3_plen_54_part_01